MFVNCVFKKKQNQIAKMGNHVVLEPAADAPTLFLFLLPRLLLLSCRHRRGIHRLVALLCPLVRRVALGAPRMDALNLLAQGGVDEAVALERVEPRELRGHDDGGERLAAAAYDC